MTTDPNAPDAALLPCPRCGSPNPKKHPAVQFGGEVSICPDAFHARAGQAHERRADAGLLAALQKYGRHDPSKCRMYVNAYDDCTCGLSAAIAAAKGHDHE